MLKIKKHIKLDNMASATLLLTSGTEVFCLLNYKISMAIIIVVEIALLYRYKSITKTNFYIALGILIYAFTNTVMNGIINLSFAYAFALSIKLIFVMTLASTVSFNAIRKVYINMMVCISIISLICFSVVSLFPDIVLPFEFSKVSSSFKFYGTIYYTRGVSISNVITRNAGIFAEPGVFQIFLNIALVFILFDEELKIKIQFKKIIIIIIAVLTTMSTTGYICLALTTIAFFVSNKQGSKNPKLVKTILYGLVGLLVYFENKLNVVVSKAIDQGGSYGTRIEDTKMAYKLTLNKPIFGHGALVNNMDTIWATLGGGNISRSNGLANTSMFWGIPYMGFYLVRLFQKIRVIVQNNLLTTIVIFIIFVLCLNTESVLPHPFFLYFLFNWNTNKLIVQT